MIINPISTYFYAQLVSLAVFILLIIVGGIYLLYRYFKSKH